MKSRNHWPEPKPITWQESLDLLKVAKARVSKYWDKVLMNTQPGDKLLTIKAKGLEDASLDILQI